jgi:hypothetical protein
MVELVITAPPLATLRVQRKDAGGPRGKYLELHDVKKGESVTMKEAAAGNRIKAWFIGPDEKLLPGSRPAKRTISREEDNVWKRLGWVVLYDGRSAYFEHDPHHTTRKQPL